MFKKSSLYRLMLLTFAVVGLTCTTSASRANVLHALPHAPRPEVGAATPRQVLPALSDPRSFRQGIMVSCNVNNPTLGTTNMCIMVFDAVPAGKVLQIDKLNCLGGNSNGTAIIFNTQIAVDGAHIVGFVLPPYDGIGGAVASGPYYFKAGEKPKLFTSGDTPTDQAFCSMTGTLWQAN